jgi:hypothetical protein
MPTAVKAKSTMSGLNGTEHCVPTLEFPAIHRTNEFSSPSVGWPTMPLCPRCRGLPLD